MPRPLASGRWHVSVSQAALDVAVVQLPRGKVCLVAHAGLRAQEMKSLEVWRTYHGPQVRVLHPKRAFIQGADATSEEPLKPDTEAHSSPCYQPLLLAPTAQSSPCCPVLAG